MQKRTMITAEHATITWILNDTIWYSRG